MTLRLAPSPPSCGVREIVTEVGVVTPEEVGATTEKLAVPLTTVHVLGTVNRLGFEQLIFMMT